MVGHQHIVSYILKAAVCLDTALLLWCWVPYLGLRMLDRHYATGLEVWLAYVSLPHGGSAPAALFVRPGFGAA